MSSPVSPFQALRSLPFLLPELQRPFQSIYLPLTSGHPLCARPCLFLGKRRGNAILSLGLSKDCCRERGEPLQEGLGIQTGWHALPSAPSCSCLALFS